MSLDCHTTSKLSNSLFGDTAIVVHFQPEPNRYVSTFDSHPANVVFLLRSVWFSVFCLQNGLFLSDFASFNHRCRVEPHGWHATVGMQRSSAPVWTTSQFEFSLFAWQLEVLNHVTVLRLCFTSQAVRKRLQTQRTEPQTLTAQVSHHLTKLSSGKWCVCLYRKLIDVDNSIVWVCHSTSIQLYFQGSGGQLQPNWPQKRVFRQKLTLVAPGETSSAPNCPTNSNSFHVNFGQEFAIFDKISSKKLRSKMNRLFLKKRAFH